MQRYSRWAGRLAEEIFDKLDDSPWGNRLSDAFRRRFDHDIGCRPPDETAFLSGSTPTYGAELWEYKGGTTVSLVSDIIPGAGHSYAGQDYGGFTQFNGNVYFTALSPDNGFELHRLGANGAVSLVADINGGPDSSYAGSWGGFTRFDGDLYFTAFDPVHGSELRKLTADGTVVLVADINSGSGSSDAGSTGSIGGFTAFEGSLYFTAFDPDNGYELRKLGADGAVSLVADIYDGPAGSGAGGSGLVEFDGELYFTANDPIYGTELRKLDAGGTISLVADINGGSGHSSAGLYGGMTEFKGELYFSADDPVHGMELRKLNADGDVALVADIWSGPGDSWAGSSGKHIGFTEFDGDLYFTAADPIAGWELRKLDGVTGEVQTFDLLADGAPPGEGGGSNPQVLGVTNGWLAIAALFDKDGDGPDEAVMTMLASQGEPTSVADFRIVDDGSGSFAPGPQSLLVTDNFSIA